MHLKEDRFKMLLESYLSGKISVQEQDEFFELITSHQFDAILESEIGNDLLKGAFATEAGLPPHISQEIMRNILSAEKITAEIIPVKRSYRVWSGVAAAAIVIIVAAIWFLFSRTKNEEHEFAATIPLSSLIAENSSAKPKIIVLADGSRVELQPNSVLHYPLKFSDTSREVYLEGKAFFEVTHDPGKPFMVFCNHIVTKVLGTSFYINTNAANGTDEVSVRTGKVRVSENNKVFKSTKPEMAVIVTPNQKVVYEPARRLFETKLVDLPQPLPIEEAGLKKKVVGQEQFVYEHEKLGNILQQLENTYGIEIITENPAMNNCVFTGNVAGEDLYTKLKILCVATGSSYEINGTKILLTGKGCNQ